MSPRTRSALVVFLFLAVSITVALSIDYTDTYVADRFHKTLASEQFTPGENISLGRFIEYYDWDKVYVIFPDQEAPDLSNQFGLPYNHHASDEDTWSLVFVKDDYVTAEITIQRDELEFPDQPTAEYYDRWSAIVVITEKDGVRRMEFVGE